jgi:hypothetical protein
LGGSSDILGRRGFSTTGSAFGSDDIVRCQGVNGISALLYQLRP